MDATEIAELECLLTTALEALAIRRGQSEQLSSAQFRQVLRRCRTVYDPNLRLLVSTCEPEISQIQLKEQLLQFVNRQLRHQIRDGKIHSASFVFSGGAVGGSPIEQIVRNLVTRTILDGPAIAARAFADCTTNTSCSIYRFFLLTGVGIPESFEVFDGITLVPLPESQSELPPHLPIILDEPERSRPVALRDLLGRTLVRIEYEVSPVFHRPSETYTFESGPDQHFSVRLKGQEIADPSLDTLCQALAVVGRCRVQSVLTWSSLLDYEIFDLGSIPGVGASGYSGTALDSGLGETVQLGPSQMETIKTLYVGLTTLPTGTWEKLRIPIDRWAKAMAEENPIDQIVELGISLESLYVPDSQGESGFRLAHHAAWHLGKSKSERTKLVKEFRQIYAARSDVVHTGRLRGDRGRPSFDVSEFVTRAQELCWQGITSVIEAGEIPNWSDIAMGEDSE